jgi:hypothetical protein
MMDFPFMSNWWWWAHALTYWFDFHPTLYIVNWSKICLFFFMGIWYLLDFLFLGKILWFMFELDNLLVNFLVLLLKVENDQVKIWFQLNLMWKWPQKWSYYNLIYVRMAKMIIQPMWKRCLDWWSNSNSIYVKNG